MASRATGREIVKYREAKGHEEDCGDGRSGRYGAMSWDGRANGSSDRMSGCNGTVQLEIATGAVAVTYDDA